MDRPVTTLILLVAGVMLIAASASFAFAYLIFWQNSGRVFIEGVDILWTPSGSNILVTVRNAGGVPLSSCTARMLNPITNIDDVVPGVLPPGGVGTFVENNVPGLNPPNIYVFEVSCQTPQGLTVVDKKSAQPHL
jgi:hypothetical protein